MRTIAKTEINTQKRNALFLILLGIALVPLDYWAQNFTTAYGGLAFTFLSMICYYLFARGRTLLPKILWATLTPIILIVCPFLFSMKEPSSLVTYGFLHIGGLLFCTYALKSREEQYWAWVSIVLFFIGFISYSYIIAWSSFGGDSGAYGRIYLKITQAVHFLTLVYFMRIVLRNRLEIEYTLMARIKKLNEFTANLVNSSKSKLISENNLNGSLEEILRSTADVLDVSRMSVWEYVPHTDSIKLVVCYDSLHKTYSYDGELFKKDYPTYFELILSEKTIVADDALANLATREFLGGYLKPNKIYSMLDTPFFLDGKFKGILCFEEQRGYRKWDEMDQLFSISVGKLVSISYHTVEKRHSYYEMMRLTKELQRKKDTLESINSKIMQLNESLTVDLIERQKSIQDLHTLFEDITFKNAHLVRAPLCRILALTKLINMDPQEGNKTIYLNHLEIAAKDLESILKEVSILLSEKHGSK